MLYTIYTRYLNQEPVCHGTIECENENTATIYAYHMACDIFHNTKMMREWLHLKISTMHYFQQ